MFIQLLLLRKHKLSLRGSFCLSAGVWVEIETCGTDLALCVCLRI